MSREKLSIPMDPDQDNIWATERLQQQSAETDNGKVTFELTNQQLALMYRALNTERNIVRREYIRSGPAGRHVFMRQYKDICVMLLQVMMEDEARVTKRAAELVRRVGTI